jgi:hypothetical protein
MLKQISLHVFSFFVGSVLFGQETETLKRFDNLSYIARESIEVDSLQMLNLIVPKTPTTPPLLIWIGGGAWSYVT